MASERKTGLVQMTSTEAATSLRAIADEHEQCAGSTASPREAGHHMARMLVLRTAADRLSQDAELQQQKSELLDMLQEGLDGWCSQTYDRVLLTLKQEGREVVDMREDQP